MRMRESRRILIISIDRENPIENMEMVRRQVIDQVNEGVVLLPPWITGTVADIDISRGDWDV